MKHALVIGGTGMLSGAVVELLKDHETVSVMARYQKGFEKLKKLSGKDSKRINPLKIDYNNYSALTGSLKNAAERFGGFNLVLSWIHSTAPLAPFITAKVVNDTSNGNDFFDILGSSYTDPSKEAALRREKFSGFDNIKYHQVILGFVTEGNLSRWLTNDEIYRGVIEAVKNKAREKTIGILEPFSRKP
jgi:hypothetical protein